MKRSLPFLICGFLLLIVLTILAVFGAMKQEQYNLNVTSNLTPSVTTAVITTTVATVTPTATAVINKPLEHSAWIPNWGSSSGITSLKNNSANLPEFKTISPVWYEVKEDGSLITKYPSNRSELENLLRSQNIKIVPAIAMFDHELFTKVLQNPENLQRHIDAIVNVVISNNYDGIDLDYESTKLDDKEKYFDLIKALSTKLHAKNKVLVTSVVAQWGENIVYPSLKETRKVQDWSELAKYVDEIRIMAYDYTFIKANLPGPIAPLNWVRQVAEYAITEAPAEKFSLGIALYAYRWQTSKSNPDFNYTVNFMENFQGNNSAEAYQYSDVKNILKNNGKTSEFDGETLFTYENGDKKYALSYFTEENLKAHIDLAEEFGFKGVCYWRLGNEATQLKLASSK